MLKGLSIVRLRSFVKVVTRLRSSRIGMDARYPQTYRRNLKTSSFVLLPKVSSICFEQTVHVHPEKTEQEDGVEITLEQQISAALSVHPWLTQVSRALLKKFLCNVLELGFSVEDGILMVSKCKDILVRNQSQLQNTLLGLRQCKFSDEDVVSILRSSPEHFLVDPLAIVSRYNSLRIHFSQKSLKFILSNCPRIGLMKWEVVQKKLEYLRNVMNIPTHQIAQSRALDCPFSVIRARHLFLERAGLYKTPDPKSSVRSANHTLSSITDTEDEYFAVKIAGLTVEEYIVFQELLLFEERERESDDEMENI